MGQGSRVELKAGAYFATAVALMILPLWFFLSLSVSAIMHELCHYLALKLAGVRVFQIVVGPFGASIDTDSTDPKRELVCALAGPAGSLMLVPFFRWLPGISLCGLIQGIFNLLPVYPMDGGRILNCFLEITMIPHRDKILSVAETATSFGILGFGVYMGCQWNLGWGGVITGVVLLLRIIRRNTSCKESRFGVQ